MGFCAYQQGYSAFSLVSTKMICVVVCSYMSTAGHVNWACSFLCGTRSVHSTQPISTSDSWQ